MRKIYLGDGVYCEYDDYNLILTTENGIEVTNTIVLEPIVYMELIKFVRSTANSDDEDSIEQ